MKVTLKVSTENLNSSIENIDNGLNSQLEINTSKLKLVSVPTYTEELATLVFPSPIIVKNSGGGTGGASRLRDLEDVTISFPQDGDLLIFDGYTWVNKANTYFDSRYLRKDIDDIAKGHLTFLKGTVTQGRATFKNELGSEIFASGFSGTGWELNDTKLGESHLTIDNLTVRRTMNVYELIVNQLNATNGSLWVSDSIKVKEVLKLSPDVIWITGKNNTTNTTQVFQNSLPPGWTKLYSDAWLDSTNNEFLCKGYFPEDASIHYTRNPETLNSFLDIEVGELKPTPDNPENVLQYYHEFYTGEFFKITYEEGFKAVLRVNDLVKCQKWEEGIYIYNGIVTNTFTEEVNGESINGCIIRLSDIVLDDTLIVNPVPTDTVVRIGNTVDVFRQGAIYLTSSELDGPYLDILDKVNNPIFKDKLPSIRLGNLEGITDDSFPASSQPTGFGLYGENVYLKGKFVQVTDEGSSPVPTFRGKWNTTSRYYVNDQVTHLGELFSAKINNFDKEPKGDEADIYWLKVVDKGEAGESIRLKIQSELFFKYKENFETFLGPEYIKVAYESSNIDIKSRKWYIKDSNDVYVEISTLSDINVFPTDSLMQANYSILRNKIVWVNNTLTIKLAVIDSKDGTEYTDIHNIGKISDGAGAYSLTIMSSRGNVFKPGLRSTRLKAYIYFQGDLVEDKYFNKFSYLWERYDKDGNLDTKFIPDYYIVDGVKQQDSILIDTEDVYLKTTFNCTITKK